MTTETALSDPQVRALLSLIDDESPGVREVCRARALELGERCVPLLGDQARSTTRPGLRRASHDLAVALRLSGNLGRLRDRIRAGAPVLEAGCLAIAQIADPHVDGASLARTLDEWAARLRPAIGPSCSVLHAVDRLRAFANDELDLRGDEEQYGDPRNSLLDQVLERRRGIPITLSAVWLLLARRVGIPLHGLGIPSHFLVGYHHEGTQHFLDPFHRGRVLEHVEVTAIIRANHLPIHPAYFRPVRDVDMLFRMTNNLIAVLENGDPGGWLPSIHRLRQLLTDEERA